MFDKLDFTLMPAALRYDIDAIHTGGKRIGVSTFVPDYDMMHDARGNAWLKGGLRRQCLRNWARQWRSVARIISVFRRRDKTPLATMAGKARKR